MPFDMRPLPQSKQTRVRQAGASSEVMSQLHQTKIPSQIIIRNTLKMDIIKTGYVLTKCCNINSRCKTIDFELFLKWLKGNCYLF